MDIQTNLRITNYLNVKLNLYNGTVSPFKKNDQYPCYINVGSYHPRQVFKYIPNSIMVNTNTSDIDILTLNKHEYETALKKQKEGQTC